MKINGYCNHIKPDEKHDDFPARCGLPYGHNTPEHKAFYEHYKVNVRWPNEDYHADFDNV